MAFVCPDIDFVAIIIGFKAESVIIIRYVVRLIRYGNLQKFFPAVLPFNHIAQPFRKFQHHVIP